MGAQANLARARDNAVNQATTKLAMGPLGGAGFAKTLEELAKQLELTQTELDTEKQRAELSQKESDEFDKIAKKLEKQMGNGANGANKALPFLGPTGNAWYRAKTPAQQREIKQKLQDALKELEAAQIEKAAHEVRHDAHSNKLEKIRSRTATLEELKSKGKTSSFVYQQEQENQLRVAEAN